MAEPARRPPEGLSDTEAPLRPEPVFGRGPDDVVGSDYEATPNPVRYEPKDLIRWGPIVAGLFSAFASLLLLSLLGLAIGFSSASAGAALASTASQMTAPGLWAAGSMLIALFIGG